MKSSKLIHLTLFFILVISLFAPTGPAAAGWSEVGNILVLGQVDSPAVTVSAAPILNRNPEAIFAYTPDHPNAREQIQFINMSSDPDGLVTAWHWDFGDGITSTEKEPRHVYMRVGTYPVTLTVTDDSGAQDALQKEIIISRSISDLLLMIAAVTVMVVGLLEAYLIGRKK